MNSRVSSQVLLSLFFRLQYSSPLWLFEYSIMEGYGMQGYDWKCKDYVRIPITVQHSEADSPTSECWSLRRMCRAPQCILSCGAWRALASIRRGELIKIRPELEWGLSRTCRLWYDGCIAKTEYSTIIKEVSYGRNDFFIWRNKALL